MIDTKALRNKILDLAISGKLTEQLPEDGNAEDLYAQIQEEKARHIAEGKIKKEKTMPPIMEDEIPFEIPENWKWVRFSEIVDFYLGKTPARANKEYWEESIYPWVSISDMPDNGVIYKTKEGISEKAKNECFGNNISKAGTLIMSFKLTIGKVALLGVDAYHNEAIISIFPFCDNDESIKLYLFRILPVVANNTDSHGVVMGNTLNKKSMSNMLIPLPPTAEQKRIVSAVEDAFAVIDKLDKAQEDYKADQEVLRKKIIDAGIQGKLTEQLPEDGNAEDLYAQIREEKARLIAEGKIKKEKPLPSITDDEIPFEIRENWKWVRLSSIFNFIDYRGATPNKIDNGVPFVTAKNVRQGYVDYSIQEYISEEDYNKRQSRGVSHKGDLLFTTEAPMGYAAIADLDKFSAGQRLITLQQLTKQALIENKYYMYVISSAFFQKQLEEKCSGTTVKGIKAERLKMLLVPLLSTEEQNRIVKKIETVLKCF